MSIIPEGTTHEYSQPTTARWRNLSGDKWSWWGGKGWIPTTEDSWRFAKRKAGRLAPVSAGWDGEGLPPVGTVCECRIRYAVTSDGDWTRVICRYALRNRREVVVEYCDTNLAGNVDGTINDETWEFRPIRTPEQIAAEELRSALKDACAIAGCAVGSNYGKIVESVIKAGYRKQVAP